MAFNDLLGLDIPADRPVLIAGPTASGKSSLALALAERDGGRVINADALQVYGGWRILTARPSAADEARVPHALYGHIPRDQSYSVGHWLRQVEPLLSGPRPIIVGGTGLYFAALTEGLAEVPPTPPEVRAAGDALSLEALVAALDPETAARIDLRNRARVQRAWEVLTATGRPLREWQQPGAAPLLPLAQTCPILILPGRDILIGRIEARFDQMMDLGLLAEAEAMAPTWDPAHPSSKAIGAQPLMDYLAKRISQAQLRDQVTIATRQYAKRQRTWFRARMQNWHVIEGLSA